MSTSTLTSKGQTTIPKDIREHLALEPGDRIEFLRDEQGRVYLVPAKLKLSSLAGFLSHGAPGKPVSLDSMDKAIAAGAAARQSAASSSGNPRAEATGAALGDRAAEGSPAGRRRPR
jgi:AbrB family looped-hinge helix DNA binding protein